MESDTQVRAPRTQVDRRGVLLLLVLGVLGSGLFAFLWFYNPGVTVVLTNRDPAALPEVVLFSRDGSYPVGDVQPGETVRVVVKTKSESNVQIEFRDTEGRRKRLVADCYFERRESGTISVVLDREKVISADQRPK